MLGGINWVGLYVEDVEALVPFYRDALGLTLTGRTHNSALFTLPGGIVFELSPGGKAQREGRKPHAVQGMQIGLAVDDLDAARAALAARGVPTGDVQTFADWRWARVVDPEGNVLQLVERGGNFVRKEAASP